MIVIGKGFTGGMVAASGVLLDDKYGKHIQPGDHGCTYGGNPLAMATCHAAVKVVVEEGLVENSKKMGQIMLDELRKINSPVMKEFRGRGCFVGMEVKNNEETKVHGIHLT